ncbi:CysS/YqeB C-terminal domain-containing protein [Micromonospora phytophila]|uniref:CysS/YqeB C-terminal domain-containing protein n=1 Tax=Micromonospora phytophila TaxID=709888 RepID=UPI003FD6EF3F
MWLTRRTASSGSGTAHRAEQFNPPDLLHRGCGTCPVAPDTPTAPRGATVRPALTTFARGGEARELRGELARTGVVVRDDGRRQYWRLTRSAPRPRPEETTSAEPDVDGR